MKRTILFALALPALAVAAATGGGLESLKAGKPDLQSAGALAFGPDGVLFVGDSQGAAVFALDTADTATGGQAVNVEGIDSKIAALLGVAPESISINDLAVHPVSKRVYLSVSRGRGPDAAPVILRLDGTGKITELALDGVRFSKAALPNPVSPEAKDRRGNSLRHEAITDLAYLNGKVYIAGLSNEEFASTLRSIDFPFSQADPGTSIEIYHGNHAAWETRSPVRTFVPYEIQAEPHLLAAYTCTPLVKFPVKDLKPGTKVVGTTIAELGNRNRPLDMILYKKGAVDHILMANSSRGVMKMSTQGIEGYEAITTPVEDKAGLPYETIESLSGVEQLDKFDETRAVILARSGERADIQTIALP